MANLLMVIGSLEKERKNLQSSLDRVTAAISALNGATGKASSPGKRTMSASARARIAAAQKARWARWRTSQRKKR
jgi:hypothetical protein